MTTIPMISLAAGVAVGSWAGVALVRRYAARHLLDLPNERSSHSQPTPRGGGLALVVAHLLGMVGAAWLGIVGDSLVAVLIGAGTVVAAVGFVDDHRHVPAPLRLSLHFLAFGWATWWLGGLPPIDFGWSVIDLGWVGTALMVCYCAWFLNLFNFMDGIDGIAAAQALSMSLSAAVLLHVVGPGAVGSMPLGLLASSTAGFLVWNWPPARIFMGDVGSGYLGFALGALAIWTVGEGWLTPWVWLILGGAFLADATVTLFVRACSQAKLAAAHRSHAYQRLSRHWGSHRRVTVAFATVNFCWLGPWALAATLWPRFASVLAICAVGPLFVLAARLGAGHAGEIAASRPNRSKVA